MGYIHSIETLGLVDGPGIRVVVFMQGCKLRCKFCHNPDTWFKEKNLSIEPEELVGIIRKYRPYFEDSNGGVTFSGGEPLLQIESLEPLLKRLKEKGINICFETSLSVSTNLLRIAIDYIDELFIDIKLLDKKEAKDILNMNIDLYNENLEIINNSEIKKENIIFRIPLNMEYTSKEENVNLILNLLEKYDDFKVEIFKTHNLAKSKYESLNKEFKEFQDVNDELINEIHDKIEKVNSNVSIISL